MLRVLGFLAVNGKGAPVFLLVTLCLWLFQHMYAIRGIQSGGLLHFLCVWLLGVVVAFFLRKKLFSFYMLFEFSLIPTLLIVFFFGYQPEKLQAFMYLLMYTVMASLPLLLLFLRLGGYLMFGPSSAVP